MKNGIMPRIKSVMLLPHGGLVSSLKKLILRCHVVATLTVLLLFSTYSANAQTVDDYVSAQMQWEHIPGLSLAVVKDGKVIKAKGYGLANVETNTHATPETVYKIASVSKQFLAAGIMLLVQDNKIGLNDRVNKYLDDTPAEWKDITIRNLLTHTSGIIRDSPGFEPYKIQADIDVIKATYSLPLDFPPGDKWEYSNVNYYILAEIIHKASGMPWSEFISERIFEPTGMRATKTTTSTDIIPNRASGYDAKGDSLHNAENWLALRPSGAFLSTVLDFAKWDAALYSDNILSDSSREQMWTETTLPNGTKTQYGYGWFIDVYQGHRRVHHKGGVPGFTADFERYVDDRLTVIVMTNVSNRDTEDLALHIAGFYAPALVPAMEKVIPDNEPDIAAQIRKIVAGLVDRNLDMDIFNSERVAAMTGMMKSSFPDDIARLGKIQSVGLLERKSELDNRIYRYQVNFRNMVLFVQCTFDKNGKITKFSITD